MIGAEYSIISFHGWELPPQYHNVIYSKWLRSLRHGNDYFKLVDAEAYYSTYRRYIEKILSLPETVVRLAVIADDHDVVLGFSVSRKNILDYIHVLRIRTEIPTGLAISDYRRHGIGAHLLPPGIDTFTHLTKTALTIWGSKFQHWKFNPFA